jgi:hypothetical protein
MEGENSEDCLNWRIVSNLKLPPTQGLLTLNVRYGVTKLCALETRRSHATENNTWQKYEAKHDMRLQHSASYGVGWVTVCSNLQKTPRTYLVCKATLMLVWKKHWYVDGIVILIFRKVIRGECEHWSHLTRDKIQCWASANSVIKLKVPQSLQERVYEPVTTCPRRIDFHPFKNSCVYKH